MKGKLFDICASLTASFKCASRVEAIGIKQETEPVVSLHSLLINWIHSLTLRPKCPAQKSPARPAFFSVVQQVRFLYDMSLEQLGPPLHSTSCLLCKSCKFHCGNQRLPNSFSKVIVSVALLTFLQVEQFFFGGGTKRKKLRRKST